MTASRSVAAARAAATPSPCRTTCSSGLVDVTVDFDVWVDPTLTSGNWFMYNLGNSATYPNGTGYLFTTNDSSNPLRSTIAENGYATEQSAARAGRMPDRAVAARHLQHRRRHPGQPGRGQRLRGRRAGRDQRQPDHQPVADGHAGRHHDQERPGSLGLRRRPVVQGQAARLPDLLARADRRRGRSLRRGHEHGGGRGRHRRAHPRRHQRGRRRPGAAGDRHRTARPSPGRPTIRRSSPRPASSRGRRTASPTGPRP